jgi:hypothetical protein
VCADCGCLLAVARRPRPRPRPVVAAVPAMAVAPAASLPVPFGPRAGQPVSTTRLGLAEPAWAPAVRCLLGLVVVAAALLVVLAARGM